MGGGRGAGAAKRGGGGGRLLRGKPALLEDQDRVAHPRGRASSPATRRTLVRRLRPALRRGGTARAGGAAAMPGAGGGSGADGGPRRGVHAPRPLAGRGGGRCAGRSCSGAAGSTRKRGGGGGGGDWRRLAGQERAAGSRPCCAVRAAGPRPTLFQHVHRVLARASGLAGAQRRIVPRLALRRPRPPARRHPQCPRRRQQRAAQSRRCRRARRASHEHKQPAACQRAAGRPRRGGGGRGTVRRPRA
mmetsp:Transcript_47703/g.154169  ORF Transcript_47703/g.154169 Transcript_47703/m.154169 type:complete len:246 (-) Transcript_47703:1957-2694(-)